MVQLKMILFIFGIAISFSAHSAKKFDVNFEDKIKMGSTELVLNGIGIRLATIFNVKVYVAGLYLEAKSNDPKKIMDSKGKKKIQMVFKRDVDKEKIQNAWKEGFENQCQKKECKELQPKLKKLNSLMADMKEGQSMVYNFEGENIEVLINGASKGKVEGSARMGQILLGSFIGKKPPNEELKEGLLGK